jgi:hypothetical protein
MIKMSVKSAKRLVSVKAYVPVEKQSALVPVIEKSKPKKKRKKQVKNVIGFIKTGNVYKLNLKELK